MSTSRFAMVTGALVAIAAGAWTSPAAAGIYWANSSAGAVGHANLDGSGATQTYVAGQGWVLGVAADDAHVFWSRSNPWNAIAWANRDGSNVADIHNPVGAFGLAAQGTLIYWGTGTIGGVGRGTIGATVSGVTNPWITSVGVFPHGVAVDAGHVYWTDDFGQAIGRANIDGTGAGSFITGDDDVLWNPTGVAVNSTHLFWSDTGKTGGRIGRANIDGSGVDGSFITGAGSVQGLAIDRKHIYWTQGTSIARANLDGTGVDLTFITGATDPLGIAVDGAPRDGGGSPSLTGGTQVGSTFTCNVDDWTPQGDQLVFRHTWLRNGVAIDGATASTYPVVGVDAGKSIACRMTAFNDGGEFSATTDSVYVPVPPTIASAPAVSGNVAVGETLTCSPGAWYGDTPLTYGYVWTRDGGDLGSHTASTFVITESDQGHTLGCTVTATGPGGQATAASSGVMVPAAPGGATLPRNLSPPAISGLANPGHELTCSPGAWTDAGGMTFTWLLDGTQTLGTGTKFTAGTQHVGHELSCRVTASNALGQTVAVSPAMTIHATSNEAAPQLSRLRLTPVVFRAALRGASVAVHTVVGTKVTYRLTRTARVTFTVLKRTVAAGGTVRYVRVKGSFRHAGKAGPNNLRFRGRVSGRTLRPGRYRLRAVPRDPAGNRGGAVRAAFQVTRR